MQLTLRAVPKASLTNRLIVFTTLRRIWILTGCCQWPGTDTTFAHREHSLSFPRFGFLRASFCGNRLFLHPDTYSFLIPFVEFCLWMH